MQSRTSPPLSAGELWTVGHSNRTLRQFLELLQSEAIARVVDVRRFPSSRRHPHFGGEPLQQALREAEIDYRHLSALGGRRSARADDSPNTAWRVESFNAYADYMLTPQFAEARGELELLASEKRTAIMCAEALPWRCHRRLIADSFVALGWQVHDIVAPGRTQDHALPDFARISAGNVIYPGGALF
jgi:uncharacterized protein (DUF488 family)